eukprot:scaffold4766_cov390-Prasinococcus_capsulatus_cf.AAC.6
MLPLLLLKFSSSPTAPQHIQSDSKGEIAHQASQKSAQTGIPLSTGPKGPGLAYGARSGEHS